ncbi:peptidoglycan DD-metalloendopeptidase family protein [Patescibacteria group bacterium]|nr:peptidoglycan DD-metalloendopeptidase family protein [Patescibacteria group bacterium]
MTLRKTTAQIIAIVILIILAQFLSSRTPIFAESKIEELRGKISEKNEEISEIEKDIEKYQTEIDKTLKESKTLKNQISQLNSTANKLGAEIKLTNEKIDSANLTLEKLEIEIGNKNNQIENSKESLAEVLRRIDEEESQSLLETLLKHGKLSDFFDDLEGMEQLQGNITAKVNELKDLKNSLEKIQGEKIAEKNNLSALNAKLGDQKKIAQQNKKQKDVLLQETKNREENYKKLLDEKLAKKEAFEKEIMSLEGELRIQIDPNSLPPAGSGVLAWPLDKITITQYFGNTPFATENPQVYGGMGHNGIDFRASVGTPVKASASGIVEATGNTDLISGCYSYGQWVLIKHNNGLSTLYAHLSLTKVAAGQNVVIGDIIGYSGQTGYATGPHLHFTVYATQGVKITKFTNSINCKNAVIPIADKKAYLNPLSYL